MNSCAYGSRASKLNKSSDRPCNANATDDLNDTSQAMLVSRQFRHFFKIFLKLKGARFLWLVFVILCLLSNTFIYIPVSRMLSIYGQKFIDIKEANDFVQSNTVLVERDRYNVEISTIEALLRNLGTRMSDPSEIFESCPSQDECIERHFDLLYRGSSTFTSLMDFKTNRTSIVCNMVSGGELYCPFLSYLAGVGQLGQPATNLSIKAFRLFRSIGRFQPTGQHVVTEGQTLCDLDVKFPSVFPAVVTAHAMFSVLALFFYFLVSTVICVYDLKGNGFLQLLVLKGLSVRAYWLVLWLVTSVEVLLCAAVVTISYAAQCPRLYLTNVLMKLFGYCVVQFYCIAALSLLITVLVKTFGRAAMCIGLVTIASVLLNLVNRMLLNENNSGKTGFLFLPPGHFGEYVHAALLAEVTQSPLVLYHTLAFVITGTFAFVTIIVTLYLDFVLKTGNGMCLEPGYIFSRQFWCPPELNLDEADEMPEMVIQLPSIEPVKENLRPLVSMVNVSKAGSCSASSKPATALRNITVTIYESQITAIIGHNRAGKSSLMSILTGRQRPTSGSVSIGGYFMSSPLTALLLRGQIGVCMQHNALSDSLTVSQSINMALISSGLYLDESEEEMVDMLNLLRLTEKLLVRVCTLSDCQKRKLCIALALLGNPKLVFMDEPTKGVDPLSRQRVWKLLQEYKLGRAIVFTTQFMDEADTLADQKILLSSGSLICAGSSAFLKGIFDCGFIFKVTLKSAEQMQTFLKRVSDKFSLFKLKKQFRNNLELQVSAEDLEVLPTFAAFLEESVEIISAYGLAQPTLGDIFVRLKDMPPDSGEYLFANKTVSLLASEAAAAEKLSGNSAMPNCKLDTLECRALNPTGAKRIVAMFILNVRRNFRMKSKFCLRFVVPVVLLLGLTVATIMEHQTRGSWQNRRTMDYESMSFDRGVCVYDYPNSEDNTRPTPEMCCELFNTKAGADLNNFKILHKEEVVSLTHFLENKDVLESLKQLCSSSAPESVCPVFHTNIWNLRVENAKREVNIGAYSMLSDRNVSIVASIVMSVTMRYFSSSLNSSIKVHVETVDDWMAVLIPLLGAFFQIVILTIVPATYLDDVVEDRETKVKCQLSIMGVNSFNYWFTTFLVHWVQYAATYIISVILLITIMPNNYLNLFYLSGIVLPTLFFGLSNNLLCAYLVSTFLSKLARVGYMFFSMVVGLLLLVVQLHSAAGLATIYAVPPFASVALTFYGTKVYFFTSAYYWIDGVQSRPRGFGLYFMHIHVYHSIIAMVCHTGLLCALLGLLENRKEVLYWCANMCQPPDETVYPSADDPGVIEEAERIDEHRRGETNLLELRHIRKIYPAGVKAVRDATFGVMPGEIFGLLGPNGAGKTSILSIIVGDEEPTYGDCEIKFKNVWYRSNLAVKYGAVGYCPQHNPLFPGITISEHLWFYAKVLGIHETLAMSDIKILVEGLGLQDHLTTPVGTLSDGLRRRTCLAISLLGNPSIVIIDEASGGVDPEGKQFIWSIIKSMATSRRALIITTKSIEEAEALCTRVGIINHGLMVSLGSVPQLINLYGEWFTLDIQLKAELSEQSTAVRSRKDQAIKAVILHFGNSKVIEQFTTHVTFLIPSESVPLMSAALSWLVAIKEELQLKHFSFYQLSLEQVFEFMLKTHDDQIQRHRLNSVFSVNTQLSEFDNMAFT